MTQVTYFGQNQNKISKVTKPKQNQYDTRSYQLSKLSNQNKINMTEVHNKSTSYQTSTKSARQLQLPNFKKSK
jgi:hypothetical protein